MKRLVNFSQKHIFFIIVGNMIGVGVFITPNWVASQTTSPIHFLSVWVIGALIAVSGGIAYATLAKTFPQNGGDYQYLKKTSHKLVAQAFASAMLWFAFPGSIASLALGASNYSHKLLQLILPASLQLLIPPQIIAFIFIAVFLIINLNRLQIAINIQQILVVILILSISIFLFSTIFCHPSTITASASSTSGNWLMAILSVYFSYIGFASIGYIGGEIKLSFNKLKKWAIISVVTVSLIYILLNYVYIKFIPFEQLQIETVTVFLILKDLPLTIKIIVLLAITGAALGSLNVVMITGGRLFEFILQDNIKFKNKNYLNYSLIFISAIGIIYLFTNTFEKILSGTTWSILIFSFVTILAFIIYSLRKAVSPIPHSFSNWLAIGFFALATGILSIYGFVKYSQIAFNGFIYISIGFIIFILLFYFLSEK